MLISFKDFLGSAQGDLEGKAYIDSSIAVTHTFKQLEALAKSVSPLSKSKRVIFGCRLPDGSLDLRFISSKKMERLSQARARGELEEVNVSCPAVRDILRACQHDEYSTPLLLMTSSDMVRSSVWVDTEDSRYIRDTLRSIISSIQVFENDVLRSDERKRQMHLKLIPAGAPSGVLSNADEICHRGFDKFLPDLDREDIIDRIQAYNLRLSTYDKILNIEEQ